MRNCRTQPDGCIDCPSLPAIPSVPAHYEPQPVIGWNAGADSIPEVSGNLKAEFTPGLQVGGIVIGLKRGFDNNTVPVLIDHGFHLQSDGTTSFFSIVEKGVTKIGPFTYDDGTRFGIRRAGTRVTYYKYHEGMDDEEIIYKSRNPSYPGLTIVNACMYLSGDVIQ